MNNLILVTVSGPDQPGITAKLMKCIIDSKVTLSDMGQAITHGLLSLSFLLDIGDQSSEDAPALKELLFTAKQMKMELEFETIKSDQVIHPRGDKYIISCVALDGLTSKFIYEVSSTLAEYNINIQRIDNVSEGEFKCLEVLSNAHTQNIDWTKVKEKLLKISTKHSTDIAILRDNVWRRNKRLIVFDMDSTLIKSEVIVEMAKVHGVGKEVHEITERAMNGEIDFDESLRQRVKLLKGLEEGKLSEILGKIELTDGVEEFVTTVKSLGYKVAIISGGFNYFANAFKERLGLDYAFSNELDFQNGILTGEVKGTIVNAEKKAILVDMLSQQEGINLEQVVAIGDGANDLQMLAKAGLGIAFHAKEIVKKNAEQNMSHGPMTSILYFLGIPGIK